MYRGWVLKKLTVLGTLNKRADSMTLVLFSEQKDKKFSKDICKIMVTHKYFIFQTNNKFWNY